MTTTHTVRRAVFPGSFDLFTLGHLNILKRSLEMFDEVIVALAVNAKKRYFFDIETRKRLVLEIVAEELTADEQGRVKVEYSEGEFIVNFAQARNAKYLVRGLRGLHDFADEYKNQLVNLHVNPEVEVVFLMCPPKLLAVSSSVVKENVGLAGWEELARKFVPEASLRGLRERAAELKHA